MFIQTSIFLEIQSLDMPFGVTMPCDLPHSAFLSTTKDFSLPILTTLFCSFLSTEPLAELGPKCDSSCSHPRSFKPIAACLLYHLSIKTNFLLLFACGCHHSHLCHIFLLYFLPLPLSSQLAPISLFCPRLLLLSKVITSVSLPSMYSLWSKWTAVLHPGCSLLSIVHFLLSLLFSYVGKELIVDEMLCSMEGNHWDNFCINPSPVSMCHLSYSV